MKNLTNSLAIATTGITLVLGLSNAPANALNLNFTQLGWDNGGTVSGVFAGQDNDGNGFISLNEVSTYMMTFTALNSTSTIPSFTHTLANLESVQFSLESFSFDELSSSDNTYDYDAIVGIIFVSNNVQTGTVESLAIAPKPVPETNHLTALLIFGISGCLHRQLMSSKK
ncbi:hypothetical protein [Aphanothece sacrum]|uniref:Anchor protein n=1 Tax=Aphanothece sacrum FPU1 TaxID=1920663 RepID=A0A401IF86_APHSA|nr:hypothetical protein [Aphanothece sacrum]GBF79943.1 anchor protein [Aphanothece sacrum FPU1]GBF83837.1 anchor protein [Aphanothece sacrum FPU3]